MRLDVIFGVAALSPGDVTGRVVAVIDVLRASTTIATALAHGARSIVPLESSDEVILSSRQFERRDVKLAGERRMLPIPGFDLGNSPREFTREQVEGKSILLTTTNGTAALVAVQGAREVVVGSFVNFTAVTSLVRAAARAGNDIAILAAGNDRHFSLEDATCAGRFVRATMQRIPAAEFNDGASTALLLHRKYGGNLSRLFADATHGRALVDAGFGEDLAVCGTLDAFPVVPVYQDRQITKLGPERER